MDNFGEATQMLQVGMMLFLGLLLMFGVAATFSIGMFVARGGVTGRYRRMLAPIRQALGGEWGGSFVKGVWLSLPLDAGEGRVYLRSGGSRVSDGLEIEIRAPVDFQMSVSTEHFVSRLLGRTSIFQDVEIGDPSFDANYQVRTGEPAKAIAYLQDASRRSWVGELLRDGYHCFDASSGGLTVYTLVPAGQQLDLVRVQRALGYLNDLGNSYAVGIR